MGKTVSLQKSTLFLYTSSFPYGDFETFLESEYPHLQKVFDKIVVITSTAPEGSSRITASTPVYYFRYLPNSLEKISYLRLLFNRHFLREFRSFIRIRNTLPSPGILSAMLGALSTAIRLSKFTEKLITEFNIAKGDTVLYSYWCNNIPVAFSLIKNKFPEIKCVSRAHGYDVYSERNQYNYLPYRQLIFSTIDEVNFISAHGKSYVQQKYGTFKSVKQAYLGVNAGDPSPQNGSNTVSLVSCSSLIPIKQVDHIIKGLAQLAHPIKWIHFGGGLLEPQLKQLAHNLLDHKANIQFEFKGQRSNQEILQYFQTQPLDLFINTSSSEGIPVSMMEALAHGIPAIGPSVGGIPEMIEHLNNGLLLGNPCGPEEVAACINQFISLDQVRRNALRVNARTTWERKFDAATNYADFAKNLAQ